MTPGRPLIWIKWHLTRLKDKMRFMRRGWIISVLLPLTACRASLPPTTTGPSPLYAALLVKGRIVMPAGEVDAGMITLDMESPMHEYQIDFIPKKTILYSVEPGAYHFSPIRTVFGRTSTILKLKISGQNFDVPFPAELLRRSVVAPPTQVIPVGILVARVSTPPHQSQYVFHVSLDDSLRARKSLVQDAIRQLMDTNTSSAQRENPVKWIRALDQTFEQLQSDQEGNEPVKSAQ